MTERKLSEVMRESSTRGTSDGFSHAMTLNKLAYRAEGLEQRAESAELQAVEQERRHRIAADQVDALIPKLEEHMRRAESAEARYHEEGRECNVQVVMRQAAEARVKELTDRVDELESEAASITKYRQTIEAEQRVAALEKRLKAIEQVRSAVCEEWEKDTKRANEAEATLAQRDEALVKFLDNSAAEYSVRMHECGPDDREAFQQYNGHRQAFLSVKRMLPHLNAPAPERSGEAPSCSRDGCCRMPSLGCDLCPKHLAEAMSEPAPEPAPKAEPNRAWEERLAQLDDGTSLRAQVIEQQSSALPDAVKQVVRDMVQIAQAYRNSSPGLAETLERWASTLSAALGAK